jgi:hypothetical protein
MRSQRPDERDILPVRRKSHILAAVYFSSLVCSDDYCSLVEADTSISNGNKLIESDGSLTKKEEQR